jgi:hypothetical protein
MEKNYQDLCKIKEAIKKGNSKKTQTLVREHVKYFNLVMMKGGERWKESKRE